jgi:F-type H+-transporting ATPase subunit epsilon
MKLRVMLPSEVLLEAEVDKVVAEASNGMFCLLPHHVDFTATLSPGLFSYQTAEGEDVLLAMDVGVLVKKGFDVIVSTRNAVRGPDLGHLKQVVEQQYQELDEREKKARAAAARLEADLVRRFMELKEE